MSAPAHIVEDGPVAQSIAIGFRVLTVGIFVLFCFWAASNWRPVPADSQAVVLRFGRIIGVQGAGLTVSWPRPIGQVVLVPGPERLLTLRTQSAIQLGGLQDVVTAASNMGIPPGAGGYLTGDGGVVLLQATITYQVGDGAAYYLAASHIEPALQRLFDASAVTVAAKRSLDDFLVARPDQAVADPALEGRRQALRGDLVAEMNRRLRDLDARDGALGITVSRLDLDATLPPAAKIAFDGVLVAVQLAQQAVAGANTEATRILQAADRDRDQLLTEAHANADERVQTARSRTAAIVAIEASFTPATRPAMLDQIYRDQIATVLHKVGKLVTVDPRGSARVIVPATPGALP